MGSRCGCGAAAMRLDYWGTLRAKLLRPMSVAGPSGIDDVVSGLDAYGLSREDLVETLVEMRFSSDPDLWARVDSKTKSAFTRRYNSMSHKSQALNTEPPKGLRKGKKKKKGGARAATATPTPSEMGGDADDLAALASDDDDDDDDAGAAFRVQRKGKGKGKGAAKAPPYRA